MDIKTGKTLVHRNKKRNKKMYECYNYSNIFGYEYYYLLTDFNENFIDKNTNYEDIYNKFLK